jgi:hypothetical protein
MFTKEEAEKRKKKNKKKTSLTSIEAAFAMKKQVVRALVPNKLRPAVAGGILTFELMISLFSKPTVFVSLSTLDHQTSKDFWRSFQKREHSVLIPPRIGFFLLLFCMFFS